MSASSVDDQLRLAGIISFCMQSKQIAASIEPDAEVVCPVNALVEEIKIEVESLR